MYIYFGNLRFPVIQGEMNFDSSFFLWNFVMSNAVKNKLIVIE